MDLKSENQLKKKKCKLQEYHQSKNGIDRLPSEVALDILSKLPIACLLQFRFVCKSWKKLSYDPNLVNLHLSHTIKNDDPCLIFHSDYPMKNHLYFLDLSDPTNKEKSRKFDIPFCASLPEFNVVGSCNGLLCLSDSLFNDAIYVYNPFTRDYIQIPKSRQFAEQVIIYGFGFHPVTNEYKVVKIVYYWSSYDGGMFRPRFIFHNKPKSDVQIFSISNNNWTSVGEVNYQLERELNGVLVHGRLHWAGRANNISNCLHAKTVVSFDLADEQFREVPIPESIASGRSYYRIGVLGGCLSATVRCSHGTVDVWVMKEYDLRESWIRMFAVGALWPKPINKPLPRPSRIWRNCYEKMIIRAVCILNSGELLLEYRGRILVAYNQENGEFRHLEIQGMPHMFQAIAHVGSLNWICPKSHNNI